MGRYENRVEPFAVGYLSAAQEDPEYRMACGMREYMQYVPISIEPDQVFAGLHDKETTIAVRYVYGNGLVVDQKKLEQRMQDYPQYAEEFAHIWEQMKDLDSNGAAWKLETQEEKDFAELRISWGGAHWGWQGHANPDFGMIARMGTRGLKERVERYRVKNPGKDVFYDSLLIALEGLEIWAERYRKLAYEMAECAKDQDRNRLLRMAQALEVVPKEPAKDLFQAFQAFWLLFSMDGVDSPGRFDQYMWEYYREADEAERDYCLDGMWQLFKKTRTWNLCISGSDAKGNDVTNQLSYDILKIARKYKYNTPNLTMRVHSGTPEALWESAAETIATGIGMPALYNDACVCPAMEALGIPKADAHEYCMNGCNQIDIFGKSHMGLEDGEVCLAKCLELALYNGRCGYSWKKMGVETGDPADFASFEELMAAYKTQVEYASDIAVSMANKAQESGARYALNPLRSNLIAGCVEKGLDYKNRGPLYGHGQILAEGIADAVDSLAAIKHFVFDEKKYSFSQLIDALKNNFEGYHALYQDFSSYEKFGNDCPQVDAIYKEVLDHFYGYLLTKKCWKGGWFGGGCSTFIRTGVFAEKIGAMPNGKKRESIILADSIGAVPGCDKKGPTALINSVLHGDQILAKSGNVLQMKFNKNLFQTENGKKSFVWLAKTYFLRKGQQLSVNVVSREELLDALENPRNHENLIVRVGGYSDRFVNLSPALQENIIQRTELGL